MSKVKLLNLLKKLSYKKGLVTLSSGATSNFYIDCRQTVLNAEGSLLVGQLVYEHIQSLNLKIAGLGGLSLGADPIAISTAVYSATKNNPIHAFIVRKEPKDHGTGEYIEGLQNLPFNSPVLVVDDVITSGSSIYKAISKAHDAGLKPVGVFCLIDRGESKRTQFSNLPFSSLFVAEDFTSD